MKYQQHSTTSHDAAVEILESANTLRAKVYRYIRDHNGVTDEQIQLGLKMNPSTQRPRRVELQEAGIIKDSGRVQKTRSGRNAVVWIVADKASQLMLF